MALRLLNSGIEPVGSYDGLDSEVTSFLGGEVCTLTGVALDSDNAAKDSDGSDGYVGTSSKTRPAVTLSLSSGDRPLFLADDGLAKYGTLFGEVVGSTVGQVSTGGTVLGPHTAEASGKITLWDKPGHYAVSLDAVDTTSGTGLNPDNATLAVGDALYATSAGKLTPASGSTFEGGLVVARFVEFSTDRSLVTTPNHLVSGFNSPSGNAEQEIDFQWAVIFFGPPIS